ncbi:outer membrane protein assembly factor [Phascolarctobacterium sp. Marseille-Q4147]|uniref:BamA/OMP85 family outer membrane protein n=1 Tax=Phascolarctobacterium sp. Marseille-Q4147 TaxID=2823317 RepID=UPI001FF0BA6C|nr:BamA/TamA family outer membrane protein [Phascolarctobacterium sp. Marseille-Q4147]
MKKQKLWRPLTIGLTAMMLAAPVYAEEIQTPAAGADTSVTQTAPSSHQEENKLAPYIGKTITKQIIEGNVTVPEAEIAAALKTKPGMQFTEAGLSEDLSAIYDLGWFYDLRPEFKTVPEGVQVIYHVMENPVYQKTDVEGNTVLNKQRVASFFDLEQGKIANLKDINKCVQKLEEEYRSNGYILARVTDVHMEKDGTLKVAVNEGVVEGFKVKGNVKTKDYVVTREMKLKKGEPFNAKAARRSMQRVYNLGYFEDVNIKLNPGREPNGVEVEISVVEMNTGTFGIGAGYSNADGFVGMVSIGDKNFRGIGDKINLRWEFGGEDNKNYDFSYTRPWLDDKETSATINLYDITNEYADYNIDGDEIARYDKKRRGQEITFSRRTHNEFVSNYITIKNRDDIYKGEADGYEGDENQYYEDKFFKKEGDKVIYQSGKYESWMPETKEERRKENFGVTRSITFGRVYDSRDNIYDPHEGKRIGYSVEWAGGMGGDFDFTKWTADWRYYYRAGGESVWALNLGAGYASGDMPLSQRFTMGGSDTLRGYEDDQFRGNSMLKATLEYRFPIVKKVQGVLFTDNGYAWDKRHEDEFDMGLLKNSYGVGLRINSPLGPVKLDYGYGDNGGKFHFSFGGQF